MLRFKIVSTVTMLHFVTNQFEKSMVKSFHNYASKNQSLLQDWERFVDSGNLSSEIKPYIGESWKRSKSLKINTSLSHSPYCMNDSNTLAFVKENQFLINQVQRHLIKLIETVDSEDLIITLANHRSEVITTVGKNLTPAERINLSPGSRWSEEDCGTNGIGTAIKESEALSIFGHEHYSQFWHELVCTTSPIKDPFTEKMLGAITLSGPKDFVPLHNMALVQNISNMIERSIYDHIQFSVASNYLEYFRSNKPLIIFDEFQ